MLNIEDFKEYLHSVYSLRFFETPELVAKSASVMNYNGCDLFKSSSHCTFSAAVTILYGTSINYKQQLLLPISVNISENDEHCTAVWRDIDHVNAILIAIIGNQTFGIIKECKKC